MATTPDFSVGEKHVLITGGTGGIFGALAKAFLDHGAHAKPQRTGRIRALAVIFLASSASTLINGVTIPVDGGYSAS